MNQIVHEFFNSLCASSPYHYCTKCRSATSAQTTQWCLVEINVNFMCASVCCLLRNAFLMEQRESTICAVECQLENEELKDNREWIIEAVWAHPKHCHASSSSSLGRLNIMYVIRARKVSFYFVFSDQTRNFHIPHPNCLFRLVLFVMRSSSQFPFSVLTFDIFALKSLMQDYTTPDKSLPLAALGWVFVALRGWMILNPTRPNFCGQQQQKPKKRILLESRAFPGEKSSYTAHTWSYRVEKTERKTIIIVKTESKIDLRLREGRQKLVCCVIEVKLLPCTNRFAFPLCQISNVGR